MVKRNCDRKLITLYRLRIILTGTVFFLLSSASVLIFFGLRAGPLVFVTLLSAGTFVPAALLLPEYWYEQLRYTRSRDWLLIEYGSARRRCVMVPRARMQYIAVKRSFLERRLGLCTLVLSSGGSLIRLPGLSPNDAGRMRMLLERRDYYRNAI